MEDGERNNDQQNGRRNGRKNGRRDNNRFWLWTGITLGSLLLLGLLLAPGSRQEPGGRNVGDGGFMQQTPPGVNIRQDVTDNDPATVEMMNRRIADAASSVEGVQRAWGVMSGTTALVAVDCDDAVRGSAVDDTLAEVADQVEELPNISRALVTADAALVQQIRNISDEIASGNPASRFAAEIRELMGKISPDGRM